MNIRTLLTMAVAVVLGLVAVFLVRNYIGQAQRTPAQAAGPGGTKSVVVAAAPIQRGAALAPNPNRSVDTNAPPPVVNYRADIAAAKQALRQLDATRKALAGGRGSDESLKSNADAAEKVRAELRQSEENLAEYHRTHPNQFLTDLLSEDNKTVTFHRFQIAVWTLVLGVVFVSGVLTRLAMPTFSPGLLLLMGISSGTYLGFKFAPSQPGGT